MKDGGINNSPMLHASTQECLKALRKMCQTESHLTLLISKIMEMFHSLRNAYPNVPNKLLFKVAMMNAAVALRREKFSPKMCAIQVQQQRPRVKLEWLLEHQSFIKDLHRKGVSLRKIEESILYRFRKKISHTLIAEFIKHMENGNV